MSLQGELSDTPFSDLFDVLLRDDKEGLLVLEKAHYNAFFYIYKGEPYAAFISCYSLSGKYELMNGENAVHYMSTWEEGTFSFTPANVKLVPRNIFSTKRALMVANVFKRGSFSDLAIERPKPLVHPALQAATLIPHTTANYRAAVSQLNLQVREWALLIQIDNTATFQEVAAAANLDLETAWPILQKLVSLNLVVLGNPAIPLQTAVTSAVPIVERCPLESPVRQVAEPKAAIFAPNRYTKQVVFAADGDFDAPTFTPALTKSAISMAAPKRGFISSLMSKLRSI